MGVRTLVHQAGGGWATHAPQGHFRGARASWAPPCPGLMVMMSLPGQEVASPTTHKVLKEAAVRTGCHPRPHSAGPCLGGWGLCLSGFSLTPRDQANPCPSSPEPHPEHVASGGRLRDLAARPRPV